MASIRRAHHVAARGAVLPHRHSTDDDDNNDDNNDGNDGLDDALASSSRQTSWRSVEMPPAGVATAPLAAITATSPVATTSNASAARHRALTSLRWRYLCVYLCVKFADWLQSPFLYLLYEAKIDDRTGQPLALDTITMLYVARASSAVLFGAVAASLSDAFGRLVEQESF